MQFWKAYLKVRSNKFRWTAIGWNLRLTKIMTILDLKNIHQALSDSRAKRKFFSTNLVEQQGLEADPTHKVITVSRKADSFDTLVIF